MPWLLESPIWQCDQNFVQPTNKENISYRNVFLSLMSIFNIGTIFVIPFLRIIHLPLPQTWQYHSIFSPILQIQAYKYYLFKYLIWGGLCQKNVSKARTSNYLPRYLWYVISCPCPWYLLLAQQSPCSSVIHSYRSSCKHAASLKDTHLPIIIYHPYKISYVIRYFARKIWTLHSRLPYVQEQAILMAFY